MLIINQLKVLDSQDYSFTELITTVKSFIVQAPEVILIDEIFIQFMTHWSKLHHFIELDRIMYYNEQSILL